MSRELIERLADDLGGKIDELVVLPDGHGFATMSLPLPADHWLTKETEQYEAPPMPFRLGTDHPQHNEWVEKIRAAARYAVRAATMNGKENDFDPDALVQNMVVGMVGYWTADGLSSDDWSNPNPVPPIHG